MKGEVVGQAQLFVWYVTLFELLLHAMDPSEDFLHSDSSLFAYCTTNSNSVSGQESQGRCACGLLTPLLTLG